MSQTKTCSQCGKVLSEDAVSVTCSACQQREGLSPESPSRDDRVNDVILLYLEAVERGKAFDREKFLAEHADIAEELQSFFRNQAQFHNVADVPTLPPATSSSSPSFDPDLPTLGPATKSIPTTGEMVRYFGDYELLLEIARGGMGVVYKARQVNLNRVVALKMILAGQLAGPQDVQRFYTEAEAAAQLDHPGIVPVFEVGQHEGQHFFSMGFVDGKSLAARVAEGPLPAREAAKLVHAVALAVQYAHDKGVIHRDLKPGNILLDKDGRPRVTDFGLAKLTRSGSDLTGTGQILGTPSYMPPEQASGKTDQVGPASDVYSLGAILYCLLVGRPPFQAASPMDTLLQVLEQEPVPLRQLNRQVAHDLETITLKCLEKDRSHRYRSASELAQELKRFLSGEPIVARPVSSAERAWRWCRRNPVLTVLISTTTISLVAAAIISAHYGLIAEERAQYATKQAEKLRGTLAWNYFDRGVREYESGRPDRAVADITRALGMTPAESPLYSAYESVLIDRCIQGGRQLAPPLLHSAAVSRVAFSADGSHVFTESSRLGRIWNASSGVPIGQAIDRSRISQWRIDEAESPIAAEFGRSSLVTEDEVRSHLWTKVLSHSKGGSPWQLIISPDRNHAVTTSPKVEGFQLQLWDVQRGIPIGEPLNYVQQNASSRDAIVFSPDGKVFRTIEKVSGGTGVAVIIREASTGIPIGKPMYLESVPQYVAFSPNSKFLVTRVWDWYPTSPQSVRLWNVMTGDPVGLEIKHASRLGLVTFSPDSSHILTTNGDNSVRVWDSKTASEVGTGLKHERGVDWAAYSPDGTTIVTRDEGNTVRFWNAESHSTFGEPMRHEKAVVTVEFSGDGATLVTVCDDNAVHLWNGQTGVPLGNALQHGQKVTCMAFSLDGTRLVTGSKDRTVRIWAVPSLNPPANSIGNNWWGLMVISPNDRRFFTQDANSRTCRLWDVDTSTPLGDPWIDDPIIEGTFSPDNTRLVVRHSNNTAQIRDGRSGAQIGERRAIQTQNQFALLECRPIRNGGPVGEVVSITTNYALTADGNRICTVGSTPTFEPNLLLWDTRSGTQLGEPVPQRGLSVVAFSPDGKKMLTAVAFHGSTEGSQIWDTKTGKRCCNLQSRPGFTGVHKAAFTPDSARVVTSDDSHSVWMFDSNSGFAVTSELKHTDFVEGFAISPQGTRIVTIVANQIKEHGNTTWLWDSRTGKNISSSMKHHSAVVSASFSPDGTRVITTCEDNSVRLWDAQTGTPVGEGFKHEDKISSIVFSPDNTRLVTASWDRSAVLFDARTGVVIGEPMTHPDRIEIAAFTPDGKYIVSGISGRSDGVIRLWEGHTGVLMGNEIKHFGELRNLRFSSNGKFVFIQTSMGGMGGAVCEVSTAENDGLSLNHRRSILQSWAGCESKLENAFHALTPSESDQVRQTVSADDPLRRFATRRHAANVLGESLDFFRSGDLVWLDHRKKVQMEDTDLIGQSRKLATERTAQWHRSMARRTLASGNWFAARFHASRGLRSHPEDHEFVDVLIRAVLEGKSVPENVVELISRIKELDPANAAQLSETQLKGWMEHQAAIAEFRQLISRAESFVKSGEPEKAADAFARAYELSPQQQPGDSSGIAQNLCYALLSAGKVAEYRSTCAQVRERFGNSNHANEVLHLCRILILIPNAIEDLPSVVSLAKKAVNLDQRSWWAHHVLAGAYLRNGEYEESLKTLDEIQRLNLVPNPPNIDSWLSQILNDSLRAIALLKLRRIDEARDVLQGVDKSAEEHLKVTPEQPFGEITRFWWNWCPIQELRREAHEPLREFER